MGLFLPLMVLTLLFHGSDCEPERSLTKVPDEMLRTLYLWSAHFEDIAQRSEDMKYKAPLVHDRVIIDSRPVMVPAFPSAVTFLFMTYDPDKFHRLEIIVLSKGLEGVVLVSRYAIPNMAKYKIDTFDPEILQTLKFEDFMYLCNASMREIERNIVFSWWPDCNKLSIEKHGNYHSLSTCNTLSYFTSADAIEINNPNPYIMNITKRYPLSVLSPVIGEISDTWNPCTGS